MASPRNRAIAGTGKRRLSLSEVSKRHTSPKRKRGMQRLARSSLAHRASESIQTVLKSLPVLFVPSLQVLADLPDFVPQLFHGLT